MQFFFFSRVKLYFLFKKHIYSLNKSVYMFVNVLKLPQSQSDNLCVHMRERERERGPKAVSVLHPTLLSQVCSYQLKIKRRFILTAHLSQPFLSFLLPSFPFGSLLSLPYPLDFYHFISCFFCLFLFKCEGLLSNSVFWVYRFTQFLCFWCYGGTEWCKASI